MAESISLAQLTAWVRAYAALIEQNAQYLTELDSAIGDADHGTNMKRGMKAVVESLDWTTPETADALFKQVGMKLVSAVGGASGPLYGTLFLRMGVSLGAVADTSPQDFAAALRAGLDGVVARGKAQLEDKTMVDALTPAIEALEQALAGGSPLQEGLDATVSAAEKGRDSVTPLVARKGRASYLGERSAGHQDPGATSTTLLLQAAADSLAG
jgi:phosphoenolpyruvate---glycerone phosphotransferase subunit DhaL